METLWKYWFCLKHNCNMTCTEFHKFILTKYDFLEKKFQSSKKYDKFVKTSYV